MELINEARRVVGEAKSIAVLTGDAIEQLGKLVQNEVQLAKAEMGEKMNAAVMGAVLLVVAAALLLPALVLFLIAIALWLTSLGFSPIVSHLMAGGIAVVVSAIFAMIGASRLKPENLKPKVTMEQVQQDMATAKELAR